MKKTLEGNNAGIIIGSVQTAIGYSVMCNMISVWISLYIKCFVLQISLKTLLDDGYCLHDLCYVIKKYLSILYEIFYTC